MIKIENLSYSYQSKPTLFDGLNLELFPGNIYGLLGQNGAGKSTLLKLLSGLLKPRTGSITVSGFKPFLRDPRFLQDIYMVNEEFYLPAISIRKYISLYSPFYAGFQSDRFENYLQEFKLNSKDLLNNLSYGQKKKFVLSFGLATNCRVLILDEPTNGLDIPTKSLFRKLISGAIDEEKTFIISTHQVRDMENLIDPILILDEGEIVFNQDMYTTNEMLKVSKESKRPIGEDVIYMEEDFSGFTSVRLNHDRIASNINLELLFNAVINNKQKTYEVFNQNLSTNA